MRNFYFLLGYGIVVFLEFVISSNFFINCCSGMLVWRF
ncbi:hypothetical Protein pso3_00630 [Candidatus Phytoplasma solani]